MIKITNGEYITRIVEQDEDFCVLTDDVAETVTIEVSLDWWNKLRKAESTENDTRADKCKNYEDSCLYKRCEDCINTNYTGELYPGEFDNRVDD